MAAGDLDGRGTGSAPAPRPSAVPPRPAAPVRRDPFVRAENEDDDGYDPYSDRPADPDPQFERDPWR